MSDMPRDETIARLRKTALTQLDIIMFWYLHEERANVLDNYNDEDTFNIDFGLGGQRKIFEFKVGDIKTAIAYLRLSKQI